MGMMADEQVAAMLPHDITDEQLVVRTARGDVGAFTLLYQRHAGPVYAMAAHMLGAAEAEEIVQRVFLHLWDRARQFDATRGTFSPWFMTIARHDILDELRKRSNRRRLAAINEVEETLATLADPAGSVEDAALQQLQDEAVAQALRDLPPDQRRVLLLAYFGGLSQTTIAEQLGLPLGTVKKRTLLGMQKLRRALSREELTTES